MEIVGLTLASIPAALASSPIAVRCIECIQSMQRLCDILNKSDLYNEQISLPAVQDEFGRFRVWAGNVGAHRSGRVSLDYRLREAGPMRQIVTSLLDDLKNNLREALAILSGKRLPYDEQSDSDSSESSSADTLDAPKVTTEIQQILIDIKEIIAYLYELSITLRNPAPRDRILKLASIDVSHFEEWDMRHVEGIFPRASSFLLQRLGKANTKRRQVFKYLERHHRKLAHGLEAPLDMEAAVAIVDDKHAKDGPKGVKGSGPRSNIRSDLSTIATTMDTQTTITTFIENNEDMTIDEIQSETSSAASEDPGEESILQMPKPPKGALDGQPIECPYCYDIIKVFSTLSWRGHVFKDLKPYVCSFSNCTLPNKTFGTRREWFDHEVHVHRRLWSCYACQERFSSKPIFVEHVKLRHPESFADHQLQALVDMCTSPVDQNIKDQCPLCLKEDQHIRRHMARHMRSLALFVLPRMDNNKCEDTDSNGVQVGPSEEQDDSDTERNALSNSDSNPDIPKPPVNDVFGSKRQISLFSFTSSQGKELIEAAETAMNIKNRLNEISGQSIAPITMVFEAIETALRDFVVAIEDPRHAIKHASAMEDVRIVLKSTNLAFGDFIKIINEKHSENAEFLVHHDLLTPRRVFNHQFSLLVNGLNLISKSCELILFSLS